MVWRVQCELLQVRVDSRVCVVFDVAVVGAFVDGQLLHSAEMLLLALLGWHFVCPRAAVGTAFFAGVQEDARVERRSMGIWLHLA